MSAGHQGLQHGLFLHRKRNADLLEHGVIGQVLFARWRCASGLTGAAFGDDQPIKEVCENGVGAGLGRVVFFFAHPGARLRGIDRLPAQSEGLAHLLIAQTQRKADSSEYVVVVHSVLQGLEANHTVSLGVDNPDVIETVRDDAHQGTRTQARVKPVDEDAVHIKG